MNIYTKSRDGGMTSLVHGPSIPKSDDRIELLGTLDELISHLGLVKADLSPSRGKDPAGGHSERPPGCRCLTEDPHNRKNRLEGGAVEKLEAEIDAIRETLPVKEEALPGKSSFCQSVCSQIRCQKGRETSFHGQHQVWLRCHGEKYMNRLGDYLYVLARSMEAERQSFRKKTGLKPQKETEMTEKTTL